MLSGYDNFVCSDLNAESVPVEDNIFDLSPLKPILEHAYQAHLSQRYKDDDLSSLDLFLSTAKRGRIERPNHALAHTIRKVMYVAFYMTAIKEHCTFNPNPFKNITTLDIRKLQAAMIFSVTGRECDVEPPGRYNIYKIASGNNFRNYFLPDGKGIFSSPEEIETYARLVQFTANGARTSPMPEPKARNEMLARFLTNCHALDERRCWNSVKYKSVINGIAQLIGEVQANELKNLVFAALKATGNKILFEPYQEDLFYPCSTSVDFCIEQLQAIPCVAQKLTISSLESSSSISL